MAPIKLEDKIKEQLDKRHIEPSAGSWDRLSSELDKAENNSFKRRWWPGVAAAVAAILVIGTFVLREPEKDNTELVEEPAKEQFQKPAENVQFQPAEKLAAEGVNSRPAVPEPVKEQTSDQKLAGKEIKKPKSQIVQNRMQAEPVIFEEIVMPPPAEIKPGGLASENAKEGWRVSDAEVDALLANASKKIGQERKFSSADSITPGVLLSEFEAKEDESTKTKVFQFLKEGYLKAKTTIAQRND